MRTRCAPTVAAAALLLAALHAQDRRPVASSGDWPMYTRDLACTRHSPLTQITPANLARLFPGSVAADWGAGEKAWPCQKPPWGNLIAVNASTGA